MKTLRTKCQCNIMAGSQAKFVVDVIHLQPFWFGFFFSQENYYYYYCFEMYLKKKSYSNYYRNYSIREETFKRKNVENEKQPFFV